MHRGFIWRGAKYIYLRFYLKGSQVYLFEVLFEGEPNYLIIRIRD